MFPKFWEDCQNAARVITEKGKGAKGKEGYKGQQQYKGGYKGKEKGKDDSGYKGKSTSWESRYQADYKGADKGQGKAWGKGKDPNPSPNPQNPFVASAQANQQGKGNANSAPVYVAGVLQTPAWGGGWGPALQTAAPGATASSAAQSADYRVRDQATGNGKSQVTAAPQKKVGWHDQQSGWRRWERWEEDEEGPGPY